MTLNAPRMIIISAANQIHPTHKVWEDLRSAGGTDP
jgi:hypothetical protein